MADKNAGQQYIASLKFRIDEAKKQMAELSKLTSDTSKSIGQELSNKIFTVKKTRTLKICANSTAFLNSPACL